VGLSYDRTIGHLFVIAAVPVGAGFLSHFVEIDPNTGNILRDILIDTYGGGGIHVRDDGVWQARFAEDVIRQYTRDLIFVRDVSVAASFAGFPGPEALTSSFVEGGFFIVDYSGSRIVEVDITGREIAAVSTATLGDGRGLAIDSDKASQRIFLQIANQQIYVLSSEFLGPFITIDIRPRFVNIISPRSSGLIPVAILTTDATDNTITFDATSVNPNTVRFGSIGTEAAAIHAALEDVDGDGDMDMILYFRTLDTDIDCGDSSASLIGTTLGGLRIQGTDSIVTVGCK
jgi:hypothetical protein